MENSNTLDHEELITEEDGIMVDNLPDSVVASMEVRDRWFTTSSPSGDTKSFLIGDLVRWLPGQTLRVAFLGGDTALHRDIEDATRQITDACNIKLDFGFNPTTGKYRTWSTSDTTYSAEIRVSFDQGGYFSLLGNDSISPNIGAPGQPVGGRPNQRSLNLGGFHVQRPASWKGTTRHEFLHALAFHHEHQSPSGGCDSEFRWEDDPGYQPTRNAQGVYIIDANGKRPGIYTYLAGAPNFWGVAKVDHNLRQIRTSDVIVGGFDRGSIMLYRFQDFFYRTAPSPCAPIGDGQNLSTSDKAGLRKIYPHTPNEVESLTERRLGAFKSLLNSEVLSTELKKGVESQLSLINPQ